MGRRAEIEELSGLLGRARLLTLVGPPGCGKTRLALEVAAACSSRFADGVAFVDLAPIRDPRAVPDAVCAAVALAQQSTVNLPAAIGSAELLLLIDNAEHLLDAVCSATAQLLNGCTGLRILLTSRELLNVDGEILWPVEPLPVPPREVHDPDWLSTFESVVLFCQRAAEQNTRFRLTVSNSEAIAAICRRVDGIPLALELAAASLRSLGPVEIVARLENSTHLLTSGKRTATPRHRTMHATIEWSYAMLDAHEQLLLQRLAVFAGTFDLAGMEGVAADGELPQDVVSKTLIRLIDKSLVMVQSGPSGKLRYGLLEVVRQFARHHLSDAEAQRVAARHAHHYAALTDELSVASGDFEARVLTMTADYPNVVLAMDWAARCNPEMEATMAKALMWYWMLRGMLHESSRRFQSVLSKDGVDPLMAGRIHLMACTVAQRAGDRHAVASHVERASALADSTGDTHLAILTLSARGLLAANAQDWHAAETWFRRLIQISEQLPGEVAEGARRMHGGPVSRAKSLMMARNNLAMVLLRLEHNEEALVQAELALEASSDVFERSLDIGLYLDTAGRACLALARSAEARERFIAALDQAVANANDHMAVSPLFGLALVADLENVPAACLTFAAAARRAASESGTNWHDGKEHPGRPITEAENRGRKALSVGAAASASDLGLSMDIRAALTFAQRYRRGSPATLTPRESEVVRLVAEGLTDREIATRLSISSRTVEVHLARVRRKLGLHNRAEVAVWTVKAGDRW